MQKIKKRKIVSAKECKHDLELHLELLFYAVDQGIDNYNQILSLFPVESRARALEANILNSKIIEAIQGNFSENWKFGKYRRFILRVNGYNILFKKLNNKDMPMNVRTKHVEAIENQYQLSLFEESSFSEVIEPIVFFGYKKDKWGAIIDPKLVYIDEGQIKWTISQSDVTEEKTIAINPLSTNLPQISVRPQIKKNIKKTV
jgi:hypothetical protein